MTTDPKPSAREQRETERQTGRSDGGQSGGGAYPNPHAGKEGDGASGGLMGHGGQTEMPYHGTGQLGEDEVGENANAPAEKTRPGKKDDFSV
jgi:hypothetical protein